MNAHNLFSCRPLCKVNCKAFTCYFNKGVQLWLIEACFQQLNQANTCRRWLNTGMHTVAFAVGQHTSLHGSVCVCMIYMYLTDLKIPHPPLCAKLMLRNQGGGLKFE